ncbi:MAG: capsular exopolysaccharide biosynthesis protein, partial [Solirubrobacterales bacterium]|nr:capsular exopolysaccharide biosynthesis protein [Solirubrobacterales bacterium]
MDHGAQQWRAVWAYRWSLLVFVVAAAAATYLVSKSASPRYEAQALVQIVPGAQTQGNLLTNDQSQSIANAYLETAKTTLVYALAAKQLHVPESTVASDTDVQTQQNVLILQVFGDRGDAADAARFANAYAAAFSRYVANLQAGNTQARVAPLQSEIKALTQQRGALAATDPQRSIITAQLNADIQQVTAAKAASVDIARVLQPATAPGSPTSPKPTRNAVLALIAALILGIAVVVAYTWISDRYRSAEEAAADVGLPILGEIPRAAPADQASIEAFRRLRTAVLFGLGEPAGGRRNGGGGATVLVAADERGVGKTHTTVNLGRSLASEGWRVVVVDGDLRRPTVHEQFGLRSRPGLAELLTDRTVHLVGMAAQDVALPPATNAGAGELKAVVGGTPVHDSTERLSSRYMADVVEDLERDYDFVLIDSAPLALVVDAVVLSRYSRGVVVVVDARRSKRRDVRRAVAALRAADSPILGLVFNRGRRGGRL